MHGVVSGTTVNQRPTAPHPAAQPGDCVILNAANSTVGQVVIQLCCLLRLRAVAVVSDRPDFDKTALWLRALGAAEVLLDEGSLKAELGKLKFFAKPKLALDAVGGASSARLTEALGEGGTVVVYGCMSGKSPLWSWHTFVFGNIQVLRAGHRAKMIPRHALCMLLWREPTPPRPAPAPARRSRASTCGSGCASTRSACPRCSSRWRGWWGRAS